MIQAPTAQVSTRVADIEKGVLSPLVGERQREGGDLINEAFASCLPPSPRPSPLKGEGVGTMLSYVMLLV
jgi:hypothetical protein